MIHRITQAGALAVAFVGALTLVPLVSGASAQTDDAKWFVLRQETTNYCWTALLISVNGQYAHSFANIASDPYDSKSAALAREQELEKDGSCVKAS